MKLRGTLRRYYSFYKRRLDRQIQKKAEEDMKQMDSSLQFMKFKQSLRSQGQTIKKPTIQANEINQKARPFSTENGTYLYTKPVKQTEFIPIYKREAQREQFAAFFDRVVGLNAIVCFSLAANSIWKFIAKATTPYFLPIQLLGLGTSLYYLKNNQKQTPISQVLYDITNNKIKLRPFQSQQILQVGLEDAQWDLNQRRAFYIIRLKNIIVKEENKEVAREAQRVTYLYKNAHIDFQLMHACFSEDVKRVEFTFN